MTRLPIVTRSRIATLEWITQSAPIRVPAPIVTFGKMTVLSPIAAPSPIATNAPIETSVADARVSGHRGQRVHTGRRTPRGREQSDGAREGEVRIRRPQHRARRRRRVVLEQDSRGARLRHRRFVLRIGEEGEIAGLSVLDARDADDLHLAVALEAAGEPFSELA